MNDRLRFVLNRLRERLWLKPLLMCLLSAVGAFVARLADRTTLARFVPEVTQESVETLLSTISASMLVIATLAVASMVSAYANASSTATPRAFPLVVSDDISQNALSTFIGAFIFSIVALIAIQNGYYEKAGRFALFALTVFVFAVVILTFVRWVDRIARLGRLGTVVAKVEAATRAALELRRRVPRLGGVAPEKRPNSAGTVCDDAIGFVQRVDIHDLQAYAEEQELRITVAVLPGTFVFPGQELAWYVRDDGTKRPLETERICAAFRIRRERTFDDDPRFGLVVLSQIASRALSPAVNDPGTAIDIIGAFARLLTLWAGPDGETQTPAYDRVAVPALDTRDLFDDAFTAIGRDSAGCIEVVRRLQKTLAALAGVGDEDTFIAARAHAHLALAHADRSLQLPEERRTLKEFEDAIQAE